MESTIKRGDIYYADLSPVVGSEQGGTRPVLIIQNDTGNENGPTTVVAAISSAIKKMYMPTHIMLDRTCGLKEKSIVMLEQIRTIDKTSELREYIGTVRDTQTKEAIKRGIAIEMGIQPCPRKKRKNPI